VSDGGRQTYELKLKSSSKCTWEGVKSKKLLYSFKITKFTVMLLMIEEK